MDAPDTVEKHIDEINNESGNKTRANVSHMQSNKDNGPALKPTLDNDISDGVVRERVGTDLEDMEVNGALEKPESRQKDNSHLIQIKASNAELMRRINALTEQKQIEVDINNRQEFCSIHPSMGESEETCARTCSVFVPRAGGKSHIKVSRVVNMYGPQTNAINIGNQSSPNRPVKQEVTSLDGIEERLSNMEEHLNLTGTKKQDVYRRLKSLEERILFLESLSPEYFTTRPPPPKRHKTEARSAISKLPPSKEMPLSEIDSRIQHLQQILYKNSSAG